MSSSRRNQLSVGMKPKVSLGPKQAEHINPLELLLERELLEDSPSKINCAALRAAIEALKQA